MNQKPRLIPPVYLLIAILVALALNFALPIARVAPPRVSYLGVVLIIAGVALTGYAAGLFAKAQTPLKPFEPATALVTTGIYRVTRNPMYVGLILILAGVGLFLGTVGALLPLPVFVWLLSTRFVAGEERLLEQTFGEAYLAYKRQVRRWI